MNFIETWLLTMTSSTLCGTIVLNVGSWKAYSPLSFTVWSGTGGSCRKSPTKMHWIPPITRSFFFKYWHIWFTKSSVRAETIEISSMTKTSAMMICFCFDAYSGSSQSDSSSDFEYAHHVSQIFCLEFGSGNP